MNKQIKCEDAPEGALTRYIRSVWMMSGIDKSFNDFKDAWLKKYDEDGIALNKNNPIELDLSVKVDMYVSVSFFKRKGMDLTCHLCDMAPNGGEGNIPYSEAIGYVKDPLDIQKINKVMGLR